MKVLLVEDHPLIADGIASMLSRLAPESRLATEVTCAGGLAQAAHWAPDLILLDLGLPDAQGLDALEAFSRHAREVPTVVLSGNAERKLIRAVLERGAAGFIPKNLTPDQIWSALETVLAGDIYFPAEFIDDYHPHAAVSPGRHDALEALALTPRQRDVLHALSHGLSNKEICRRLDLAEPTVKNHVGAVMRALSVNKRAHVLLWLARNGIRPDAL